MQKEKPSRLALRRIRLGLEQKQIAQLLGQKSIYQYNRLENGQRPPTLKDALILSLIFRLPITTLFDEYCRKCGNELYQQLKDSSLSNLIKPESFGHCDYLEMMNSKLISQENSDKIRSHIKILVEERANKILNHLNN